MYAFIHDDDGVQFNLYDEDRAEVYDKREHRNRPDELIDFIVNQPVKIDELLEFCVGTGRIAIPLAERGVGVVGVDNSVPMLDVLRRRVGNLPIQAVLGDCCEIDLQRKFPASLLAYNAFFLMPSPESQRLLLKNVARHLLPNGLLFVEAFSSNKSAAEPGKVGVSYISPRRLELRVRIWDPEEQAVIIQRLIVDASGGVRLRPVRFQYQSPATINQMASNAGFELTAEYGSWSCEPFADGHTNRIGVYRLNGTDPTAGSR